jgi:hypothetical protein
MNNRYFNNRITADIIVSAEEFAARRQAKAALMTKLTIANIKYDADAILEIAEDPNKKVIFLERGNEKAGFKHLLKHLGDYKNRALTAAILPKFIMHTLVENNIVGQQSKRAGRPIYRSTFFKPSNDATFTDVAITVGNNGFIVGANPSSKLKK